MEGCRRMWKTIYGMWESDLESSIVVLYILVHIMLFYNILEL